MTTRRWLLAALAGVVLAAGCSTGTDAVSKAGDFEFVSPGGQTRIFYAAADRRSPGDVIGPSLTQPDKQVKISDYPGEVVVVNIWGSWCGPCRSEVDELEKVYEQSKSTGVQLVGVDVQDGDRQSAADFAGDHKLTYPSIYDPPGRSLLTFKGIPRAVVPTTIVLDRRHRVAAVFLTALLAGDLQPVVTRLAQEH